MTAPLLFDNEGKPLQPVLFAEVELQPARVCEGFRQVAYLTIFASFSPAVCLCMRKGRRHVHVYAMTDTIEHHRDIVTSAFIAPDGVAEKLLIDLYDPASDEAKAGMEVTSRQRDK